MAAGRPGVAARGAGRAAVAVERTVQLGAPGPEQGQGQDSRGDSAPAACEEVEHARAPFPVLAASKRGVTGAGQERLRARPASMASATMARSAESTAERLR